MTIELNTLLLDGLTQTQDLALLASRIVAGGMFAISGGFKLFTKRQHETMVETLDDADIPKPGPMSWFVAANELLFGLLLFIGLFAVPAAAVLFAVSFVAFVTQGYEKRDEDNDFLFWLSEMLMRHQVLLMAILALLVSFGAGALSLDAMVFRD